MEKDKKIGNVASGFIAETRVVCKCGHSVNFFSHAPYIECSYCHDLIFRDKKAEYDYKIKRRFATKKKEVRK